MSEGPLMPRWLEVTAPDGRLELNWQPSFPPGRRLLVVVALRALAEEPAEAFWAGDFDADLIRQPIPGDAARATVWVPTGRPLWVALVTSGPDGQPRPGPPLHVEVRVAQAEPAPPALEAPVQHDHRHDSLLPGGLPELVFVEHAGRPAPDLRSLARRVAQQVAGEAPTAGTDPGPGRGGFGARQRDTLSRIGWPPPESDAPRVLIHRSTFITPEEVGTWSTAPPHDAVPLDAGVDGLVDGSTPDDTTAFYVVLEGPAPWRPLPLAPIPPLYEACRRPALIGDAVSRLSAAVRQRLQRLESATLSLSDLAPALTLIEAAARVLPPGDPAHTAIADAHARWRRGSRLVP